MQEQIYRRYSMEALDVPKVISLIINELYSKDFMPYGNV